MPERNHTTKDVDWLKNLITRKWRERDWYEECKIADILDSKFLSSLAVVATIRQIGLHVSSLSHIKCRIYLLFMFDIQFRGKQNATSQCDYTERPKSENCVKIVPKKIHCWKENVRLTKLRHSVLGARVQTTWNPFKLLLHLLHCIYCLYNKYQ